MGCGAKELGIFGDAAGVWNFLVVFREASWNFPRQDHDFKEFRGFPGMELGILGAAKSSGEDLQPPDELRGINIGLSRIGLTHKPTAIRSQAIRPYFPPGDDYVATCVLQLNSSR